MKLKINAKELFSPANILLIAAVLVVINLVAINVFGRIDLTENRIYTLSPVTKQILRDLPEPLTIKAYFTKDLPSPYNNISRFVEDQLAEMKAYGRGNFRFEFLDPADEEDLKKEAERFRLQPLQVNEMKADKVEFKLAYMGMVLIYEDRQEVIPAVQSLENLEYEIVSKIRMVTSKESKSVGFVEGDDEALPRKELTALDRELRKMYEIKTVDLSQRGTVPDGISVLCVIGPKKDLPEKARFALDQYLMKGGKLLLCINKVATDLQNLQAERGPLRIDNWTENYGFKINDDLVLDRSAPTLPFQTQTQWGRQITYVIYPAFPELTTFNRDLAALKALRQVRLYFPSSIDTSLIAGKDSLTLSPLFWSSTKATRQTAPYDINPMTQRGQIVFDQSHIPMGVLLQGKFDSYWKGRSAPADSDGTPVSDEDIIPVSPETRMVVIADANFIQDQYLVQGLDNLTMMQNLIDWLAQDEALITIRSREVGSRPLKTDISDGVRQTVKYANMIIPPLLVIGFGLVRMSLRKSARRMALRDIAVDKPGGKK